VKLFTSSRVAVPEHRTAFVPARDADELRDDRARRNK
jgi:hypothetical protein